jgi:hypothetical protein
MAFVPCEQDRFDIRVVLVERRAADAGRLGDLRHRDRSQAVLGHQRGGGVEDGVADLAPVSLDGVGPQLRHVPSIPHPHDRYTSS